MQFISKTFEELTNAELYELLKSRGEIFAVEQQIRYVDEDDVDYDALHCFFWDNGRVAAYLRAYRDPERADAVRLGRVLTLTHGTGLGSRLVRQSIAAVREKTGCGRICIDAQSHAAGFYEKLGFTAVSGEFTEAGIAHIAMELVPPSPQS